MASLTITSPTGPLTLTEADGAITRVSWVHAANQDETALLGRAAQQLNAYFYCELKDFDLPLAPDGTDFQRRVWRRMLQIPYGQSESYGEISKALDSSPRAVGGACGRNPIPIIIPCHRVIAAGHGLGGYSGEGGRKTKLFLLQLEGWQDPQPGLPFGPPWTTQPAPPATEHVNR